MKIYTRCVTAKKKSTKRAYSLNELEIKMFWELASDT